MNDKNVIEETAQVTATRVIFELRRQGFLKDSRQTPFQKTETLLYNYKNFQAAIADKQRQIETIRQEGIPKKSTSITSFSGNATYEVKTDADKADDKIEAIEQSMQTTVSFIKVIDDALTALKDDPYFDIIRLKYFEGKSHEDIADYFSVNIRTISRNRNRLVNLLCIRLFSDEFIRQIFS